MIQKIIEQYLLTNNICPLPGIGSLRIQIKSAHSIVGHQKLAAPAHVISLHTMESDPSDFIAYIAFQKKITIEASATLLNNFCNNIINLRPKQEILIDQIGSFVKEANMAISFKNGKIKKEFVPEVLLNYVLHPKSEHKLLVGDTEMPIEYMKEYLEASKRKNKYQWWIAAASMFIIAFSAIVIYMGSANKSNSYGNKSSIHLKIEEQQYTKINQ